MQSITTDMARAQQMPIAVRTGFRVSAAADVLLGVRGRTISRAAQGHAGTLQQSQDARRRGTVIEINAPLQELKVKLESGKYVSSKNRH